MLIASFVHQLSAWHSSLELVSSNRGLPAPAARLYRLRRPSAPKRIRWNLALSGLFLAFFGTELRWSQKFSELRWSQKFSFFFLRVPKLSVPFSIALPPSFSCVREPFLLRRPFAFTLPFVAVTVTSQVREKEHHGSRSHTVFAGCLRDLKDCNFAHGAGAVRLRRKTIGPRIPIGWLKTLNISIWTIMGDARRRDSGGIGSLKTVLCGRNSYH